jgi:hypothetical protein
MPWTPSAAWLLQRLCHVDLLQPTFSSR